jgi:fatty-acyl-CoA synthase
MSSPQSISFTPLTPTSFLERSGYVYSDRTAVVDGSRRFTYGEFADRSRKLAFELVSLGLRPDDRVAVLASNGHLMLEAHYGVPLAGAVLVPLNFRLSATELVHIVRHSGASLMLASADFAELARDVAGRCAIRCIVAGDQRNEYESLLQRVREQLLPERGELDTIAINYTSGTTGQPKGVVYQHRGAYLQSLAMAMHLGLNADSTYLWTLPMFHCDGWCLTWALSAAGSNQICLSSLDPDRVWRILRQRSVTHFSGAPTVLSMIANAAGASAGPLESTVQVSTGGAAPSRALIARLADLNINVTHLYGLTESYGPAVINQWHAEWDSRTPEERARLKARQGVANVVGGTVRVLDEEGVDVVPDGETIGEIVLHGNNIFAGYYRDPEATAAATRDGGFRTGDLGVMYPDGYVEVRDRKKDIIISGGENISSLEVEQVIDAHAMVLESAVVAMPDSKWGEVPIAFVTLKGSDTELTEGDVILFVRDRLAHFKAPRRVVFGPLPKTSTGKIQKRVLRETAGQMNFE